MDSREAELPFGALPALDIDRERENCAGSIPGDIEWNGQSYDLIGDVFHADGDGIPVPMRGLQHFNTKRILRARGQGSHKEKR
jgi:hypothetical protein